jgi:CheY-like chemotaxis protein
VRRPVVLIVDDDECSGVMLLDWLKSQGFDARLAVDGVEGLRAARDLRPAVILMDLQLPGIDGLTVIRTLRSAPKAENAETRIVAVTALAMPGDRERAIAAGADAYLSKPVGLREVLAVVRMMLGPEARARTAS